MMLLLTFVSAAAVICCPLTIPIWLFVLVGFHLALRRELRARYVATHGAPPRIGSRDWFLIYF